MTEASEPARILALAFDRATKEVRPIDPARLEESLAGGASFAWVDVQGRDASAFSDLLRRLRLDLGRASELQRPEILPGLVEGPDFLAFHLYEIKDPEPHQDTSGGIRDFEARRLVLVIAERFILTYHAAPMQAVAEVERDAELSFRLWGKSPAFIAFLLLQRCLYDYAHLNLANDNHLDALEDAVLEGDAKALTEDISSAGRNILLLKKLGASLQIILMTLATKRSAFVSEDARPFYHEMLQNTVGLRASIDGSRRLLDGIIASLQSHSAQRTGEVMKLLTVVSTIVLPLSLLTGIYGMNFDHMPELHVKWGYYGALVLMALVTAIVLVVFKRLGWLESDVVHWRAARAHKPATIE